MSYTEEQVEALARAAYAGDPIYSDAGAETATRQPRPSPILVWERLAEGDRATVRRVVRSTLVALDDRSAITAAQGAG